MDSIFLILSTFFISCLSQNDFLWPTWGGTSLNQQRTPDLTRVNLNPSNIIDIQQRCKYVSKFAVTMYGFATVYKNLANDQTNAVFSDFSGFITNVNMDNCTENWRVHILTVLEVEGEEYIATRNGLTLFRLSDGTEGVVFGTPNAGGTPFATKYVAALNLTSGALMWKLSLGNTAKEAHGSVHAVVVDGNIAYANMASSCQDLTNQPNCKFVGRVYKITMFATSAVLDAIWYTIPFNKQPLLNAPFDRNYYQGGGVWNWPAIIGNYFVFGSGNLYSMPQYVVDCMNGNAPIYDTYPFDPCGVDQSVPHIQWRCLESDIYPSSFNILNKNTFTHETSVRLSGTDVFCSTQEGSCILDIVPFDIVPWSDQCYPISFSGADADLAAIAAYNYLGQQRVAGISKAGMFYVFNIPSGDVVISKKIGPWSSLGGGHFSFAVSEENQIGIAHITGGTNVYASQLADDEYYCGGVIHGIDLNTGKTLYQIPNPWALTGDDCLNDVVNPDNGATRALYQDYSTINSGICTRIGYETEDPIIIHIDISDLQQNVTRDVANRATFFTTSSISGNLLFIPSATGDVFIHDVRTGEAIHILRCDWEPTLIPLMNGRRGIRAGVTVVEDRIIYFCGDGSNYLMEQETIMYSWKLPNAYKYTKQKK